MTYWIWIYDLPNWLFGVLTIFVFCAFGITGVAVTRRWAPSLHHSTVSHNDIVGFYFGDITVLYGITLGLLMIDVWSTFAETEAKVDREAGTVAALYRDVSHYPEPNRGRLRDDVRRYTRHVIDVAWPQQQRGIIPKGNLAILDDIGNDLAACEPASEGQKILHAQSYQQFNELVQRLRSRILGVTRGLSGSLWTLVLIGAVINISVTWCFHLRNKRMHFWMTGLTSTLLGLMIFLVAAMDHPYLGKVSVTPEPIEFVYDQLMKSGDRAPGSGAPSAPQTR